MGIYERRDSPFWWMLLDGTGPPPIRESTGVPCEGHSTEARKARKIAAEEIYRARMTQLARGRAGLEVDSDETFAKFSAWYETHHTARHRGDTQERLVLARLRTFFGTLRLADIKRSTAQEYITERMTTVSAGTVRRELGVLKAMLSLAVGEYVEYNPLVGMKLPRIIKAPKRTLGAKEEPAFLAALDDDEIRDLYLVGVGTLLRQSNLLNLRRREYTRTHLTLEDSKTGPYRVPITKPTELQTRAAAVLKRRLPASPDGFFFPQWQARFAAAADRGHPRGPFLRIVKRAAQAADIPWGLKQHGIVWHTATRASGATRLLRDYGVDIRTVQLMGNWASLDQMADYLGIDVELYGKAAKRARVLSRD